MGYLRLTLAMLIMMSHLVGIGALPNAAMIGFYGLSGYSITARGTGGQFWQGRFWRLWPSYAAIAAVTQIALWIGWVPGLPHIEMATGWGAVFQSAMIVPTFPESALVPAAWMIKWLILGYLLMWLGASKTPQRAAAGLLTSFVVSAYWMAHVGNYQIYYITWLCAVTATSAGAASYHLGLIAPGDDRWAASAGALSYPVFLAHYGIGAAMASITGQNVGWPLFWFSLTPTLCLSWLLVLWVEQPIARYRKSLRS
jgi:peptidoglycan/LPS O-acetylase OafA/YrhL